MTKLYRLLGLENCFWLWKEEIYLNIKEKRFDDIDINIEDNKIDSSVNDFDPDNLSPTNNGSNKNEQKSSGNKQKNKKSAKETPLPTPLKWKNFTNEKFKNTI